MRLSLVPAAALLLAASALAAHADSTYNYVGNDFTAVTGAPYTTDDFLTLSVTLGVPLPSTSSLQAYTPTAFSLSDGVQTITNTTLGITNLIFEFATSGGVIDEWAVGVSAPGDADIQSCGFNPATCGPPTFDDGQSSSGVFGENFDPGTWTAEPSSGVTPEPSTLALFGTGILGLAGVGRRKLFNA